MNSVPDLHVAHCNSCGCQMDITSISPYTNVACPDCGQHTRVKCELGHYVLTGRHAVGGMSKVFSARDVTLKRDVAIKLLNEDYSGDPVRVERFEQEALITAAISHPHIVRVFTVGNAWGHYYIAMEMVTGESLEQKIARKDALSENDVLPMAAEIIDGLRAAKIAGLIHRDVKPGNILFDASGNVKIVDFGLALVTQGGTVKADEIWATPYYVPPEALDGREEDFRSDIYALGATLYHILSGRPPISGEVKTTKAVRSAKDSVLPLAEVAPWLKAETCYLVDKAMALEPEDRFETYKKMDEALQLAREATQRQGVSEPIHSRDRAQRRIKKRSGVLKLVFSGAVGLLFAAVAIVIYTNNKGDGAMSTGYVSNVVLDDKEPEGTYNPEDAQKIAMMISRSHACLGRHEYDNARKIFLKMMNDPVVREPNASWAGIEAVIAAWLEGKPADATNITNEVIQHMTNKGVAATEDVYKLSGQLLSQGVISEVGETKGSMGIVYLMAVALKNWEMGVMDQAVPVFRMVKKYRLPRGSPLLVYRQIAGRYLVDYERLMPHRAMQLPEDIESSRRKISELNNLLNSIQTLGRSRSHVRTSQLRLHRHIKHLKHIASQESIVERKAPAYDDAKLKFRTLVTQAKFTEASELLRDMVINKKHDENERDSLVYLSDSADTFLKTLEEVIPDIGVKIDLVGNDGKKYQRIVNSKSGGLTLQDAAGETFVPWARISPSSVLSIHQRAFSQTLSTLVGQRRTEQAICFAWLTGMTDKAKLAAGKLANENRNFRARWNNTMQALREEP